MLLNPFHLYMCSELFTTAHPLDGPVPLTLWARLMYSTKIGVNGAICSTGFGPANQINPRSCMTGKSRILLSATYVIKDANEILALYHGCE